MQKKSYNAPLPKPPGIDIEDAKVLSGAKRVATRKNNDFRRMVEKKLPLFAQEMFDGYKPITPEKVIEDRKFHREEFADHWRIVKKEWKQKRREVRAQVRDICVDDNEFFFIMRQVKRMEGGDQSSKWHRGLSMIKRRKEKPLSPNADLVLAWIQQEVEPVTEIDIWVKRGDGLSSFEILLALMELAQLAYISRVDLVDIPEKFHTIDKYTKRTAWRWEALKQ